MAEITAAQVKALREKSGAGMMDCKKALNETGGDVEAAVDYLRKKGLAAAQKKAGRTAAEGLIGVAVEGSRGAIVELNAETDFVARNDQFQSLVERVAAAAPEAGGDLDALKATKLDDGKPVEEAITNAIATIGENMSLRRTATLSVEQGAVAAYVHNALKPTIGRIGVLVAMESTGDADKVHELGRQIAMHVAATQPQSVTVEGLDPTVVDRERQVLTEQAQASGKPANVIEKMVEGRLRKFYEESVLLEQPFVVDPDKKVKDAVAELAKALGAEVKVADFVRYNLGEGIERQESDLAAEVAATLAGE